MKKLIWAFICLTSLSIAFHPKEKKAFGKFAVVDLIVDFFNRVGASATWTISVNNDEIGKSTLQLTVEKIEKKDSGKIIYFDSKLSNPSFSLMNSNGKGAFFIAKDGSINADIQSDELGFGSGKTKTNAKYEKNKAGKTNIEIEQRSTDSAIRNTTNIKQSNTDGVAELTFAIPYSKLKANMLFPEITTSIEGNSTINGSIKATAIIDNQTVVSDRRIDSLSVPFLFKGLQLNCFVYSCKTTTINNTTVNGRKIKVPPSVIFIKRWYETRTNLLMHLEQRSTDGKFFSSMSLTNVQ
jgi:hypothetical protein